MSDCTLGMGHEEKYIPLTETRLACNKPRLDISNRFRSQRVKVTLSRVSYASTLESTRASYAALCPGQSQTLNERIKANGQRQVEPDGS